jgi:1-acyl-sn-glycerol-3-phosphate acyltransferase
VESIPYQNGAYLTAPGKRSLLGRLSPALELYSSVACIVFTGSHKAKRGRYKDPEWNKNSIDSLYALERAGCIIEVDGNENFRDLPTACVFIGNHMSTLETFVLPTLIVPFKKVTFVVKQSLVDYPVFKHIMRARDPITVGRTNPREDLKAVLEGGEAKLKAGTSLVIFPQTTRQAEFDPSQFNTIGVKLAKRAGVPVVPVALLTDAWGNGKLVKDFGRINPSKKVHFSFGKPMMIQNRGDEEHQKIIEFISGKLKEWGRKVVEKA